MPTLTMPTLTLPAPAKLNLFLHITGRRADGYHTLQTLFQLLDFGDELQFSPLDNGRIELTPALPGVAPEDNLVMKAARILQQRAIEQGANPHRLGSHIHLHKRLPMGGGIGGGSSNAATTLVGLNHLWQTGFDLDRLAELGASLGADVPVFVRGQSAWAEGVGERLQAIELPEKWFLILTPNCHVSTATIFSHKELTRDTSDITVAAFFEQGGRNDCQPLVRKLYREVDMAINWLSQYGDARMTGTGACVFATFDSAKAATAVLERLIKDGPKDLQGFVAKGVNQSPLHSQIPSTAQLMS